MGESLTKQKIKDKNRKNELRYDKLSSLINHVDVVVHVSEEERDAVTLYIDTYLNKC